MKKDTKRGAIISDCGKYRYKLWREAHPNGFGVLCFVLLNPSTADADQDDPTVRKCVGFASRMLYRQVIIVNLFAYRATRPIDLLKATSEGIDIVGPDCDKFLQQTFYNSSRIIAGWGNNAVKIDNGGTRRLIVMARAELYCLSKNLTGEPKHPLYIGYHNCSQLATWP